MANIQADVVGGQIRFIVSIDILDPLLWTVYTWSDKDHGKGIGQGEYPYVVEKVTGSNSTTFYRTAGSGLYFAAKYSAELGLAGSGIVSYDLFEVRGAQPCQPPNGVQRYCGSDGKTIYVWNQVSCKYDSQLCKSPNTACKDGYCVPPTTGVDVKAITVTFDNLNQPYMRTVTVTGSGSGSYQVKEGSTVIHNGNMVSGYDMFDQYGISQGSHTYCATPSSTNACDTFTVGAPLPDNRWSCADKCSTAKKVGEYSSQEECKQKCVILPQCPSTDNTLTVDSYNPDTSTPINVNVRMSSGAGRQWRVIAISGSVIGIGDKRVSTGTLILDSNGCGSGQILLTKAGQYTLVGRWCNEWIMEEHCSVYDSDTNKVTINVSQKPGVGTGCSPECDTATEMCIFGSCYKKRDVMIAGAAILGLVILTR